MNYIRQKLHQKFAFLSELSIRAKIQLLVISSILVLSIISLGGTQMIIRKYNETLYQSVETSLSYSTKEISSYLDTIDNMADQILANKTLQESLASWSDASASLNSSTYNSLYQQITNYMMGSDGRFLSYMIIKQDTKTVYSSYLVSMETPASMLDHLVDYAEQADGSVKVVSDYCNDSGLFMVRKIKESKNLSFRNLGYVLININIKELVNQALKNKMSNDISYMLLENDQLLLAEGSFDESDLPKLRKTPQNGYSLYSKDGKTFFIVRTDIPKYNFNIIYSVPYSTIYAAISRETFLICAFVIAGIILVILFSTTITALLANDFKLLIHNMQLFASGKYTLTEQEQMLSSRKDEIGMLHKGFNDMAVEINDLIEKNYVNELLKKEAQLKTLESQMDPHFLYNTLDSINWRAKAIHADDISQICTSLGSLLRITLHKDMGNFTVGEEMQLVSNYMTIQHMRYPNKLIYHCDVSENLYTISIPKFTIQPLVENAIRYSLMNAVDICEVSVTAFVSPDQNGSEILTVRGKNNGSYFEDNILQKLQNGEHQPHGFGIGLLNVLNRLQITYGDPFGLQVYNEYDEYDTYAIAEIRIPAVSFV